MLNLLDDPGEHLAPLLNREERFFVRVDQDGDDDFVEELTAALNDV